MSARREPARRVTPDPVAFHKLRAKQLRLEARRDVWRAVIAWLTRILGRH